MNIDKLIEAAKEIDRLSVLQEQKTKRYQELSTLVRLASEKGDELEVRNLQMEARRVGLTVTDFGDAVVRLRKALHPRIK